MPDDSYRLLVARLARLQAAYSAEQEQLRTWYDQQCAAAIAAVDVAAVAVTEAGAAVEAADSVVQSTDMKAHELWRRVGVIGRPRQGPVLRPRTGALAECRSDRGPGTVAAQGAGAAGRHGPVAADGGRLGVPRC